MAQVVLNMSLLDELKLFLHICMLSSKLQMCFCHLESFKCCYLHIRRNESHSQRNPWCVIFWTPALFKCCLWLTWECLSLHCFIGIEWYKLAVIVTWEGSTRKQNKKKREGRGRERIHIKEISVYYGALRTSSGSVLKGLLLLVEENQASI